MATGVYRFEFDRSVPLDEAEMSLHLAIFAVEGLYGQARVRLDAGYHLDEPRNAIIVDGTTEVGAAVVRVFTAFLFREFGEDKFEVGRVGGRPSTALRESACPAQ